MALGLIFTGPTLAASADDITEGVASSESTQTPSELAPPTTPVSPVGEEVLPETPDIQKETSGTPPSDVKVSQPTETTPSTPVTDSSETTKPQNTSAETSVAKPKYHAALWEAAYDLQPKFPQTLIHHGLTDSKDVHQFDSFGVKCGTTYQFDLYADDKITNALIAKGILNGGDESWPVGEAQVYNVFTTAPCPVVVPPAAPNPGAFQLATCGQDIVTVTNDLADAKDRLTASFVVYDNGKFLDALVALAGKPTVQSYTFAEDSGVHVITVRTGPAFGDVLLDQKTADTNCKPDVIVAPMLTVTPPTCDTDGTLPFLNNPKAQNPNGYEFPGKGYRVYLNKAFAGPGVYIATIQKVGPGFDAAFPAGTKLTGVTTQTLTVVAALGYHNVNNGVRECYVAPQEPVVVTGEWEDSNYACDDTVVQQVRTVTTTPRIFDAVTGLYSDGESSTVYESQSRDLDAEEVYACPPVVTEPPVVTHPVVDAPVAPVTTPKAVLVAEKRTATLPYTGADPMPLLFVGGVLILLGIVGFAIARKRRSA